MRIRPEDFERKLYRSVIRLLPNIRGTGVLGTKLASLYARKRRKPLISDVADFKMILDPHECVDSSLLFMPHLHDHREIAFVKEHLREGDVFVDVGANIGFYSLVASRTVGASGRVMAIEAEPNTFAILRENIELNQVQNIVPLNIGISDKRETLPMRVSSGEGLHNNRGGNSFLYEKNGERIDIACAPMMDILHDNEMNRIDGLKLDVEGFEFRILKKFLGECYPRFIILEQHPGIEKSEGDAVALLEKHGYETIERTRRDNYLMTRSR